MALSETDIDALASQIVHGEEETLVQELLSSMIDRFISIVEELPNEAATNAAMSALALELSSIVAKHQKTIGLDISKATFAALLKADDADERILSRLYGKEVAAKAEQWFVGGTSLHIKEMAAQTAQGLREIIERQNILMEQAATRTWYEVTRDAISAGNAGTKSMRDIIAQGVLELSDKGVSLIQYGREGAATVSAMPDVAIRRHVVTQVSQASGRMTIARLQAYGHKLVVTSSHYGARPTHAEWQGLPCSIAGALDVDGVHYPDIHDLTGYGTVSGLKGVNCRHSINPYYPGVTELPARDWPEHEEHFGMTSEEFYDATQRQRELERRVRKTKKDIAALEEAGFSFESGAYVQKRLTLGRQQKDLQSLCADKMLPRQYPRERAYGVAQQPRALKSPLWKTREKGISGKRLASADAAVDLAYINSAEYRKKFVGLTGNSKADEEVYLCAKAALTHRNGTLGEDLHLVSVATGERVLSVTSSKAALTVLPTKSLVKTIRSHPENTLFGVHNHPLSSPPSGSDLVASSERKYAGAIVALHNGEVYYYKHGHSGFSAHGFDKAVQSRIRSGLSIIDAYESTLGEYAERFGISWKKLK